MWPTMLSGRRWRHPPWAWPFAASRGIRIGLCITWAWVKRSVNRDLVLKWTAAKDDVAGYYVYRAAGPAGPFTSITDSLVTGTSFKDPSSTGGTYMVRAVALQTNPSGSYFNPSQGVFASIAVTPGTSNAVLTVQIEGSGSVLPNYEGRSLEIGKTYTITANPAKGFRFANWSGSISNNSPKLRFVMSPEMTLTANFEDVKRPALVITYPSKHNIAGPTISATGRTSDNAGIAAVYARLNGGDWMMASGTTQWMTPDLTLIPGKNIIQAYAVDINGNVSTTNKITFSHR
jgi:hypothetical protein